MRHPTTPKSPLELDPAIRPGLDDLSFWLAERDYSTPATDRILAYTAAEGTPTGSPDLDAGDEAGATYAYVGALALVPIDHPAWDDPGVYLDGEGVLGAPRGLDDVADRSIPAGAVLIPPELDDLDGEAGDHPVPDGVS